MGIDCEFNNDAMTCPRCGFKAGGRDWRKNCPLGSGLPAVGSELMLMVDRIRLQNVPGCRCREMARKMNGWGVDGCREHRAEIVEHLKAAYKETSWADFAAASAKAIASGLAFKLNPLDPFGSLVDEAIRLAEVSPPAT